MLFEASHIFLLFNMFFLRKLHYLIFLFSYFWFSFSSLSALDNKAYNRLLKKHVKDGFVNYDALKKDPLLRKYIQTLQKTNIKKIKNPKEKLAFWINVYNAFTLKLITDNYPVKSIRDLDSKVLSTISVKNIWKKWKFKLYPKKKEYTLDQVEHKIIRKRFKEPRIHAALVCAAVSCPPLRREAYTGAKLEKQLQSQMKTWLRNKKLNYYNLKEKTLYLSKIFDWFQKDFAPSKKALVTYLYPYLPKKVRKKIDKAKTKIAYLPYNWDLNKQ